jgi:hypothetical protein
LRSAPLQPRRRPSLLPGASCDASACSRPRPGSSSISRPFLRRVTLVITAPRCSHGSPATGAAPPAAAAAAAADAAATADAAAAPAALRAPLAAAAPGATAAAAGRGVSSVTALVMKSFSSMAL